MLTAISHSRFKAAHRKFILKTFRHESNNFARVNSVKHSWIKFARMYTD